MQGQIAAIEAEAAEVYGEEINEDIMRLLVKDFILEESVQTVYQGIGRAVSGDAFQFSPSKSGVSISGGIRVSPASNDLSGDELKREMLNKIRAITWLEVDGSWIDAGLEGSRSGSFPTLYVKIKVGDSNLPKEIRKNLSKSKVEKYPVVLRSRSLENKLFTGTGLGDLAEYAVEGVINSSESGFENAIKSSINDRNYASASEEQKEVFRKSFDSMVNKISSAMKKAAKKYNQVYGENKSVEDLFGDSGSAVNGGSGGGLFDVGTSNAGIHVKFDDQGGGMKRLSGIQTSYEENPNSKKGKFSKAEKDDFDFIKDKIVFGTSTAFWRKKRADFRKAFKITEPKDTLILKEIGFYYWLTGATKSGKDPVLDWIKKNITDEKEQLRLLDWSNRNQPNAGVFEEMLLYDISEEFVSDPSKGTNKEEKNYFYLTVYPTSDGTHLTDKVKIEMIGVRPDLLGRGKGKIDLDLEFNPSYLDSAGQRTKPFVIVNRNNPGQSFLEAEFRNYDSHKPIQLHKGPNFSANLTDDSGNTALTQVLVFENLQKIVLEILSEDFTLSDTDTRLIVEELTGADKSEIKRMIAKEIEGASNKKATQKVFQAEFNKELKKALGSSFIGEPGKINKFVRDSIRKEIESMFKDKATQNQIGDITKEVMKKLYRELSFSSVQVIDRIKM